MRLSSFLAFIVNTVTIVVIDALISPLTIMVSNGIEALTSISCLTENPK